MADVTDVRAADMGADVCFCRLALCGDAGLVVDDDGGVPRSHTDESKLFVGPNIRRDIIGDGDVTLLLVAVVTVVTSALRGLIGDGMDEALVSRGLVDPAVDMATDADSGAMMGDTVATGGDIVGLVTAITVDTCGFSSFDPVRSLLYLRDSLSNEISISS
jgi:hypothetical protein